VRVGLRDVSFEVRQSRRPDRVGDPVAVACDSGIARQVAIEERERRFRPFVVRDVAERLLETSRIPAAVLQLGAVGVEFAGDRVKRAVAHTARKSQWLGAVASCHGED
jgi:hypothetical protein